MEHDDESGVSAPPAGLDRRRILGLGAAAGAAAWVAPTILSVEAAAAATAPEPCTCGPQSPPILITVVLGPCVPAAVTVTATPTQSPVQSQNLSASSTPGIANFFGFCDGESVTVTLGGAPCTPNTSPTLDVFCQQPVNQLIFTCQGCRPPP